MPCSAEAERKHWGSLRGASAKDKEARAGRGTSSSACPHCAALEEAQSDGQHPCSQRARSKCVCTQGQGQDTRSQHRAQGGTSRLRSRSACMPPLRATHRKPHAAAKAACTVACSIPASRWLLCQLGHQTGRSKGAPSKNHICGWLQNPDLREKRSARTHAIGMDSDRPA